MGDASRMAQLEAVVDRKALHWPLDGGLPPSELPAAAAGGMLPNPL